MKTMTKLIAIFFFMSSPCLADSSVTVDDWESRIDIIYKEGCFKIDHLWIRGVTVDRRSEAIESLNKVSSIAIEDENAGKWIGVTLHSEKTLARQMLEEEIEILQKTKETVLTFRKGTWSLWQENRLGGLLQLQTSDRPDRMKPFLIRAIAKSEHTKGFDATECDIGVGIRHVSIGSVVPKSIRLPAVVFLLKDPVKVFPTWEMAE